MKSQRLTPQFHLYRNETAICLTKRPDEYGALDAEDERARYWLCKGKTKTNFELKTNRNSKSGRTFISN
jgi:hypothetical protein